MQLDQKSRYLAQHNVDSGAFHTDTMHEACQPHQTPSMGLHSRNVKRSHNGRKAAKAGLGVSGGYVAGAKGEQSVTIGAQKTTVRTRRRQQRAKTAANRAQRRAALVAELQRRGYSVN
jgi:hypothetical protein